MVLLCLPNAILVLVHNKTIAIVPLRYSYKSDYLAFIMNIHWTIQT